MKKTLPLLLFVTVFFASFVYSALPTNPDYSWNLDEGSGSTISDTFGSVTGTFGGGADNPTWRSGGTCKLDGCLQFNGSQFVDLNDGLGMDNSRDESTICLWISSTDANTIFAMANYATGRVYLGQTTSNDGSATTKFDIGAESTTQLANQGWKRLCQVMNFTGSTRYVYTYLNGALKQTGSGANASISAGDFYIGSNNNGASAWVGYIDNTDVWHSALTTEELVSDYNGGSGHKYIVSGNVKTPTYTEPPTPPDTTHNSTNVTIEFDCTGNRTYLFFDQNVDPNTAVIDNGTVESYTTTISTDGTYYYKAGCWNEGYQANASARSWVLDTVQPVITLTDYNSFKSDNSTVISPFLLNLSINITFTDDNLYGILVNITNITGDSLFEHNQTNSPASPFNYNKTIDIGFWGMGNYTTKVQGSDEHTAKEINTYKVKKDVFNRYIEYDTAEGSNIKIESMDAWTDISYFETEKLKDRYTFSFAYKDKKSKAVFRVTSDKYIDIIEDSKYSAHLITGKNWIDFEEPTLKKDKYTITRVSNTIVDVEIKNINKDTFYFSSLGGLNVNTKDYLFKIGAVMDFYAMDSLTGEYVTANVTIEGITKKTNSSDPARFTNITNEEPIIINISKTQYESSIINFTVNETYYNLTYNITPIGVSFYFYDESSEALIEGETFDVYLETTGFAQSSSATTNPYVVTGLSAGSYISKVSSSNYAQRTYLDVTITSGAGDTVYAYLINNTLGDNIVFNTVDSSNNDLEDVRVNVYRFFGAAWTLMGQKETDFAGKASIPLDTNYEYKINFSLEGYNNKEISLEPSTTDSPYTIYMDSATSIIPPLVDSFNARNITGYIDYENSTKILTFTWNDVNSYADQYCFKIESYTTTYFSNCTTSSNDNMKYTVIAQNQSITALGYVVINGRDYTIDSYVLNLNEARDILGIDTLFIALILFLTLSLIGIFSSEAAIILGIVALVGSYLFGILPIGIGTILGVVFVAVILFIAIRRSKER